MRDASPLLVTCSHGRGFDPHTGSVEPDSDAGVYNTLSPKPGRYIAPWARTSEPGGCKGGTKFDLTRFNETFFQRLRRFVDAASRRSIVVEVGLFGGYEQTHEFIWKVCPFHPSRNVNVAPGSVNRTSVYSLAAPANLRSIQIETTRRIVAALSPYDNVYYQLVNVPNNSEPAWGAPILEAIRAADPTKMVAVPAAWANRGFTQHVSVFNYPALARPNNVSAAPKPDAALAYDESGGMPGGLAAYRSSFWRWLLAGGSAIDNLDWSFSVGHERGTLPSKDCHGPDTSGAQMRQQLQILSAFFHRLPFLRMTPSVEWLVPAAPADRSAVQGLLIAGLYPYDGAFAAGYVAARGVRALSLRLNASRCTGMDVEWTDPVRGTTRRAPVPHPYIELALPAYGQDIAFRLECLAR